MLKLFRPLPFKLIGRRRLISLRPMFYLPLVFAAGIWLSFVWTFPFFPLFITASLVLFLSILCFHRAWFVAVSIVLFFILGFLYGLNDRSLAQHHIFLSAPEGRISLEGVVVSVPEVVMHGRKETVSFVLESQNFYRRGTLYPTTGKVQVFLHNPGTEISFGDKLRLKGLLEDPKRITNPYVFDYGIYLSHQGILKIFRGIGKFSVARQTKGNKSSLLLQINRLRTHLYQRLIFLYPKPFSELAAALILGFRKNIPEEIKEVFIKTGTAHLLAISGLNISLVVAFFYFVMSFLRIPRLLNFFLSVLFILIYTALAGANVPVLRAGIMGTMVFVGFLFNQERNLKSAFFCSFFVLLVWDPSVLFSASFQLSFLAMASLLYILPQFETKFLPRSRPEEDPLNPKPHPFLQFLYYLRYSLSQSLLASISATIGMLPFLLRYFNLVSVVGFICNLIAIPVCTISTMLSFVLLFIDAISPSIARLVSIFVLLLFKFELWLIARLAEVPFSHFYSPPPGTVFFIFYYSCLTIWIFAAKSIKKFSFLALLFGTVCFLLSAQLPKSRSVIFDLGKTEAFFVSFSNGSKCLINTGRHFPNNQAYWVIRSFLMARAVHRLDGILLTRTDASHAGGLGTILEYVHAARIFCTAEGAAKQQNRYEKMKKFNRLSEGDKIQFGSSSEIYIQVTAASKGRIASFLVRDRTHQALYILSPDSESFEKLSSLSGTQFDFIYLAHHDFPPNSAEDYFLKNVSADYLVLNQRSELGEIKRSLRRITPAKIVSISELGALEFMAGEKTLVYQNYLESPKANLLYLNVT